MNNDQRAEYVTRDAILKLLSDEEVARVSTAETEVRLPEGDEYVDLKEPHRGVQRSSGKMSTPMGQVLPRKAVLDDTWRQIVSLVNTQASATAPSRTT